MKSKEWILTVGKKKFKLRDLMDKIQNVIAFVKDAGSAAAGANPIHTRFHPLFSHIP